ncbi:MAG: DUF3833 family protein [Hyphomicrobiaceae bacterium]|nr:DUF3833 family protein [Hyphomicrobiaceae bacterium]
MASATTEQPMPPPFELTTFLEGRSQAWGVFEDRFGRLRRRFQVELHGFWQDGRFVLEEHFSFDDGLRERKTWVIEPTVAGAFTARAEHVVGTAEGKPDGEVIRMRYQYRLAIGARDVIVTLDDRFYRIDDNHVCNRAAVSKWGVKIGELTIFFRRSAASDVEALRAAA